jgi:uncharacterized protein YpmB
MKMRTLILAAALMMMFGMAKAQNQPTNKAGKSQWIPVLTNVDGTNTYKGVEMYYSISSCGASEVIFLKLVNTNSQTVKAQWINDVISNDTKEHYGQTKLVSVTLKPNSEVIGSCSSNIKELTVKLKDYGVEAKDVNTIVGSSFYAE